MRICYLLHQGNMHSGGQGVYLCHVTREMAALGHEAHVIVGPPRPDTAPGVTVDELETFSLFEVAGTLKFVDFFHSRHPREFLRPVNFYELGTTRFGMFSNMSAFSLRAYDRLRRVQPERRFDIVHDVQVLGYGTLLIKLSGMPVVANIHHPLAVDRHNAVMQARTVREKLRWIVFYPFIMQHLVMRRVDKIITGSHNSALSIQKTFSAPASHIEVIHDGVDIDTFRPLEGVEKEPNSILFVGNSEDRNKGARYLLEALHLLSDRPDIRLTFVDNPKGALKMVPTLVRRWGLGTRVTFTGRVPTDELVRLYNRAEILVSPSVYEGFGLPAAEAMACGTPVIATTAGAFPEVVAHDETGWLVPPGDAQALADAIRRMMSDPELRARFGEAGRRRIQERFTWRETARKTAALYEEILARRR
ncbi:MAG: glycosyltransferase family 4 protein [Dehalococcoidia bacterium]|nr:glycosyltransferase family 4 protein [Dehalococcoidia bacterium]